MHPRRAGGKRGGGGGVRIQRYARAALPPREVQHPLGTQQLLRAARHYSCIRHSRQEPPCVPKAQAKCTAPHLSGRDSQKSKPYSQHKESVPTLSPR
eukprot:1622095-Pyramimonas_sp.AAC.1